MDQRSLTSQNGTRMPRIVYGTAWKKERTADLVARAIRAGFRGIDTACQPKHYNEAGVGEGVTRAIASGVEREQLYLQTKFTPLDGQDPERVPYDPSAPLAEQVRQSCRASLSNLRTTYLDCLVIHSPLETWRETETAWRTIESLVDAGDVREIGVSNCYDARLFARVFKNARRKPFVLQNRFYAATGYDRELRAFCRSNGVAYQSFWTLTANPQLLAKAALRTLATRHRVTAEQILFRALTQIGVVPLTGTTNDSHMRADLAIFDFELTPKELATVQTLFD
jgi:diketogulonate reductase-like aldo/keto reductase